MWFIVGVFLLTYFVAAIPTGFWVGRFYGIDVTQEGSTSIGATNVFRLLGKWPAIFVLFVDIMKGFLPIFLVKNCFYIFSYDSWIFLFLTFLPMLAHSKSIYIGFKGGKSSATAFGVLLALNPLVALITISIWGITVFTSGYSSLGSIVCIPLVPVWLWLWHEPFSIICFGIIAFIYVVLIKHRSNISRLLNGTEPNFRRKSQ